MAIEVVDVRNKKTGEKTRMSVTALELYASDFERTPQQKAADRDKPARGANKEN